MRDDDVKHMRDNDVQNKMVITLVNQQLQDTTVLWYERNTNRLLICHDEIYNKWSYQCKNDIKQQKNPTSLRLN